MNQDHRQGPSRWAGLRWALAPVLLLGAGLAGLGVMTAIAMNDPSFALEKDYYEKSLRLDEQHAQQAENRKLGWQLDLETTAPSRPSTSQARSLDLLVTLSGPDGSLEGAQVTVEAFHNARAADVRQLSFEGEGEGRYRAHLASVRPGLWEFRFTVERYGAVFTSVERRLLAVEDGSS